MQPRTRTILLAGLVIGLLIGLANAGSVEKEGSIECNDHNFVLRADVTTDTFTCIDDTLTIDSQGFKIQSQDDLVLNITPDHWNTTTLNVSVTRFSWETTEFNFTGMTASSTYLMYKDGGFLEYDTSDGDGLISYTTGIFNTQYVHVQIGTTTTTTTSSSTTTLGAPPLNRSFTGPFARVTRGQPLQALRDVFTNVMGGWFYMFMMGILFFGVWLRTQNVLFPTLLLDVFLMVFTPNYLPAAGMMLIYGVNVMAVGTVLFKLVSPRYTS